MTGPGARRTRKKTGPYGQTQTDPALTHAHQKSLPFTTSAAVHNPESQALAHRAAEIGESTESLAGGVYLAEARLRELADGGDVHRMLPTWRIIRTDSTMFVGAFDAGWEGHESATYKVMETPHGPLYCGFRRMFEAILDGAERTV